MPRHTTTPQGCKLAYIQQEGTGPGVLFCTGFRSDMNGSKASALAEFCTARGIAYTRFDYSGHGASEGVFEEGTIGDWFEDALHVLDTLTKGKYIIVGSSMGGWIALLLARARPDRMHALVGLSSAPDFTEKLIWQQLGAAQQNELLQRNKLVFPDCYGDKPYPITLKLIEEGRTHLLLDNSIPIHCPVRLLHGMQDTDVPWQISATLMEKLESEDVQLRLVKNGDHRLSKPGDLDMLCETVGKLLDVHQK